MRDEDLDADSIEAIVRGEHASPFDVLGVHPTHRQGKPALAVRAFLPEARSAALRTTTSLQEMERLHPEGFFEAILPAAEGSGPQEAAFAYRLAVTLPDGAKALIEDPYRFPPILTQFDLHLFQEGTHVQLHTRFGAHVREHAGARGVSFAVWAPNALRVSVIGSFNRWDPRRHPMRLHRGAGVWELFIPELSAGALYKYHIRTRLEGASSVKADPYGFAMQKRPDTASIVYDLGAYDWNDSEWMAQRRSRQSLDAPISIYEVHLGSWRRVAAAENRWMTYAELAEELIPYALDMGATHLELLPVSEHPFDGSWGYQTVGYFAASSRFGAPDEFRRFVDRAHQAGLGVILDWVPAHFPRDAHGLGFFDGTHLYEHADPRRGHHPDWDTFIFDFARSEVVGFLLSNALFWLEEYHIDGLRVDAVASLLYLDYSRGAGEWVPNEYGGRENLQAVAFLKRFNELVHSRFPDALTIAEESTAWPGVSRPVSRGGLGFDLKWNMGWMHDMLAYISQDPVHRRVHQRKLTFSLMYAFSENFVLPLSHDEVVHGKRSLILKMPGDAWRKFANLRALYSYMFAHPGKKMLFMGGEFGQRREWHHDRQLDWELLEEGTHLGLQRLVKDLNRLYASEPALHQLDVHPDGFEWIDFHDEARSIVSFIRRARDPDERIIVVANFTPVPREGYQIGVPKPGRYRLLLNSDATIYGGSGAGMIDGVDSEAEPCQGRAHSLGLTLPPLAVLFLKTEPIDEPSRSKAPPTPPGAPDGGR